MLNRSSQTRREFMGTVGAAAAGLTLADWSKTFAAIQDANPKSSAKVFIARNETLGQGAPEEHRELIQKLLNAAIQKATGKDDPAGAWSSLFAPKDRVGIKVNGLGRTTQPVVVDAIVAGLKSANIPPENIIIWDRTDRELTGAGFKINKSGSSVRCFGTDGAGGYEDSEQTSGQVKTRFSRILAEQVDTVISVPVLKHHGAAGVSLGMKNFYGAFDNPQDYHGNNCDPYISDVVAHRYIAPRWKLTVCDALVGQYHGGPQKKQDFSWNYNGLLVGTDFVAVDAVGADIIDKQRQTAGMKSLAEIGKPAKHIATAAARGLGVADLSKIEIVEV